MVPPRALLYTVLLSGLLLQLAGGAVVPSSAEEPAAHDVAKRSVDQQQNLLLDALITPQAGSVVEDSLVREPRSPTGFGKGKYGGGYGGYGGCGGGGGCCGGGGCGGGGGCCGGGGGSSSYSRSQASSQSSSYGRGRKK